MQHWYGTVRFIIFYNTDVSKRTVHFRKFVTFQSHFYKIEHVLSRVNRTKINKHGQNEYLTLIGLFSVPKRAGASNTVIKQSHKTLTFLGLAKNHTLKLYKEMYTCQFMAVARSSSDYNAICCVLPVLWMTSCSNIMGHAVMKVRWAKLVFAGCIGNRGGACYHWLPCYLLL